MELDPPKIHEAVITDLVTELAKPEAEVREVYRRVYDELVSSTKVRDYFPLIISRRVRKEFLRWARVKPPEQ